MQQQGLERCDGCKREVEASELERVGLHLLCRVQADRQLRTICFTTASALVNATFEDN